MNKHIYILGLLLSSSVIQYCSEQLPDNITDTEQARLNEQLFALCAQGDDTNAPLVAELLDNGAQVNFRSSLLLTTPLILAAHFNNTQTMQTLIDHGADIHATNTLCYTPLKLAAKQNNREMVQLLLNLGAQVYIQNPLGEETSERYRYSNALAFATDPDIQEMLMKHQESEFEEQHCQIAESILEELEELHNDIKTELSIVQNITELIATTPTH